MQIRPNQSVQFRLYGSCSESGKDESELGNRVLRCTGHDQQEEKDNAPLQKTEGHGAEDTPIMDCVDAAIIFANLIVVNPVFLIYGDRRLIVEQFPLRAALLGLDKYII